MGLEQIAGYVDKKTDQLKKALERPIPRRTLIGSSLNLGAFVLGYAGFRKSADYISNYQKPKDTISSSESNIPESPVKKFAGEISDIAKSITPPALEFGDSIWDGGGTGALIGLLFQLGIIVEPDRDASVKLYATSGVSALLYRILDDFSTIKFARTMGDPRFREYGLDKYNGESNNTLPMHPTPKDIMSRTSLSRDALYITLGTICLPIGFMSIGRIPVVFYDNLRGDHIMKLSMRIGDEVKARINDGYTDGQIINYLNTLKQTGLNKK